MPIVSADRVKETTTTTGTTGVGVPYVLGGAATGFRSFSAGVGAGNECDYCATDGTNWEVGRGLLTNPTQIHPQYLYSSSTGSAINWGAGTKDIFVTVSAAAAGSSRWSMTTGIVAAGSTQATATAITDVINSVDTVAASTGVRLPAAIKGQFISVSNHGANTLNVYPATGETVEGLATNAPFPLLKGQIYRAGCPANGQWVGIDVNVWDDESSCLVMPVVTANPTVPAADSIMLYGRKLCGRVIPKWMPPSGVDNPMQSALYGNNVVMYMPNTGTTAGINFGTPWAVGTTVSHPTPSSTAPAMYNQLKRTRSANVATTANQVLGVSSIVAGAAQFWRGNAAGLGGFFFFSRFSIDLWPAATCRLFAGLHSGTTALVASDTIPAVSCCGIWHATTDSATTLNFICKDGTTLATSAITLNSALAAGQVFDLYIYMKPNDSTVYFRLDDVVVGNTLIDSLSSGTGTPATTTFMGPSVTMSNGTANVTVTTVAIGVNRIYVESDH